MAGSFVRVLKAPGRKLKKLWKKLEKKVSREKKQNASGEVVGSEEETRLRNIEDYARWQEHLNEVEDLDRHHYDSESEDDQDPGEYPFQPKPRNVSEGSKTSPKDITQSAPTEDLPGEIKILKRDQRSKDSNKGLGVEQVREPSSPETLARSDIGVHDLSWETELNSEHQGEDNLADNRSVIHRTDNSTNLESSVLATPNSSPSGSGTTCVDSEGQLSATPSPIVRTAPSSALQIMKHKRKTLGQALQKGRSRRKSLTDGICSSPLAQTPFEVPDVSEYELEKAKDDDEKRFAAPGDAEWKIAFEAEIRAAIDAEWEGVFKIKEDSQSNELLDLQEDHQAALDSLAESHAEELEKIQQALDSANTGKDLARQRTRQLKLDEDALKEDIESKATLLQRAVAASQVLQERCDDLEKKCQDGGTNVGVIAQLRQENSRLLSVISDLQSSPGQTNPIILQGGIQNHTSIQNTSARVRSLELQLGQVQHENRDMVTVSLKYKQEAQSALERMREFRYALDKSPGRTAEMDRLLEKKDKMFVDLKQQVADSIAATSQEHIEDKIEQERLEKKVLYLEDELASRSDDAQVLAASKKTFQNANEDILKTLKSRLTKDDVVRAASRYYEVVAQDNRVLAAKIQEQQRELSDARRQNTVLDMDSCIFKKVLEERDTKCREVEEAKSASDVTLGSIQVELDLLPEEHQKAIDAKDAEISTLRQQISSYTQWYDSMVQASAGQRVRTALQEKDDAINQQKSQIQEMLDTIYALQLQQAEQPEQSHVEAVSDLRVEAAAVEFNRRLEDKTSENVVLRELLEIQDGGANSWAWDEVRRLRGDHAKALAGIQEAQDSRPVELAKALEENQSFDLERRIQNHRIEILTGLATELLKRLLLIERHGKDFVENDRESLLELCHFNLGFSKLEDFDNEEEDDDEAEEDAPGEADSEEDFPLDHSVEGSYDGSNTFHGPVFGGQANNAAVTVAGRGAQRAKTPPTAIELRITEAEKKNAALLEEIFGKDNIR